MSGTNPRGLLQPRYAPVIPEINSGQLDYARLRGKQKHYTSNLRFASDVLLELLLISNKVWSLLAESCTKCWASASLKIVRAGAVPNMSSMNTCRHLQWVRLHILSSLPPR